MRGRGGGEGQKFTRFGSVTRPLFSLEKTYLVLNMETYCSGVVTSLQGCLDVLFHNLCCLFSVLVRYILGESISYHVMITQPLMLTSLSPAVELGQVRGEFSSLS